MGGYQGVIDLDSLPADWLAELRHLCAKHSVADGPHVRWLGRTRSGMRASDFRPIIRAYQRDWPVRQFVWWQTHGTMPRHSLRVLCGLTDCVAVSCLALFQPIPTVRLAPEEIAAMAAALAQSPTAPRAIASAARRVVAVPSAPPRWCSRCGGNILPAVEWDDIMGTAVEWRCLLCNELVAARPVTMAEARRLARGA